MTVLTIRAQDTATAMDEIVEKLGKDSFIMGTKKTVSYTHLRAHET